VDLHFRQVGGSVGLEGEGADQGEDLGELSVAERADDDLGVILLDVERFPPLGAFEDILFGEASGRRPSTLPGRAST